MGTLTPILSPTASPSSTELILMGPLARLVANGSFHLTELVQSPPEGTCVLPYLTMNKLCAQPQAPDPSLPGPDPVPCFVLLPAPFPI